MRYSVRTRIIVIITVVVAAVLGGFGVYGFQQRYAYLRAAEDQNVTATANQLANELWILVHDYNREQIDRTIETAMGNRSIVAIIVRDYVDDAVISGKSRTSDWDIVDLVQGEDLSQYASRIVSIVQGDRRVGTVQVRFTDKFMKQEALAMIGRQVMEIVVLLVVLIVVLMLAISSNILRPLQALQATFKSISQGNLEQNIDTSRKDEIGGLARSFASFRDSIRKKTNDLQASD